MRARRVVVANGIIEDALQLLLVDGDRVIEALTSQRPGVDAPILFLLEAPGPKATRERGGSGFVSPDNNDGTAANMWNLLREAGVDRRREVVTWNVVPWYIGYDRNIRATRTQDLIDGQRYTERLLSLLTKLRVVVLIGKQAARGWERLAFARPMIECPHPSPQNLNSRPHLRPAIGEALREARRKAGLRANNGSDA